MDLTKTENVIYLAVTGGLLLFMLVAEIIVIAKGKRKRAGGDVFLRVLSSLVFAVAAVLFAAAVLCQLKGSARIEEVAGVYTLFLPGTKTALPFAALFAALSTTLGSNLVMALAVLSLVALISDCLIANKKEDKNNPARKPKDNRTPEQIKRDAEIERIRRLGESAVQQTSNAAHSQSAPAEKPARPEQASPTTEPEPEPEPEFDWRVTPPPQKAELVGLVNNTTDNSFDTFDDASDDEQSLTDDFNDEQPLTDDFNDEQSLTDNFNDEQSLTDDFNDEQSLTDDFNDEQVISENDEEYLGDGSEEGEETFDDRREESDFADDEEQLEPEFEPDRNFYIPKIRTVVRRPAQRPEPIPAEPAPAEKPVEKPAPRPRKKPAKPEVEKPAPARTRKPAEKPAPAQKPVEKPAESQKPVKPTRAKPAEKPVEQALPVSPEKPAPRPRKKPAKPEEEKPAPARTRKPAEKPAPAQKPVEKPAESQKPAQPAREPVMTIPRMDASKNLPVGRRYVILDRTNAVTIFNNYLNERNSAEKDKLESNINTIILK